MTIEQRDGAGSRVLSTDELELSVAHVRVIGIPSGYPRPWLWARRVWKVFCACHAAPAIRVVLERVSLTAFAFALGAVVLAGSINVGSGSLVEIQFGGAG